MKVTDTFTVHYPNGIEYTWPCTAKMLRNVENKTYDFLHTLDGTQTKQAIEKLMKEAERKLMEYDHMPPVPHPADV